MTRFKLFAAAAVALALSASAASAQTNGLTNGPSGMRPNMLGSSRASMGINAKAPSRAMMHRHHRRHMKRR